MADELELELDFGTEELNDPNYEQKAGAPDDAQTTPTTPTDGDQGDGAAQSQQQPQQPDAGSAQAGEGGATDAGRPAQQQPQGQGAAPAVKQDDKGNLVDAKGNIVAKAGAERRTYERTQRQDNYIRTLENDLAAARQSEVQAKALNGIPTALGLNMNEAEMGLQAIASFKKDPVATARWMLQETMKMGYNLQQIVGADAQGQVSGGTLDLQAVKGMIGEALRPLLSDREAVQQATEAEQAATREYEAFLAKHDGAELHQDVIANLMAQDRTLTAEVAYWQLREYCAKHGYDFKQPLRAQAEARQQQGGASAQQQPNGNAAPPQTQMPMPNGTAPSADMSTQQQFAEPDAAWDVIVRQSMHDAGLLQ